MGSSRWPRRSRGAGDERQPVLHRHRRRRRQLPPDYALLGNITEGLDVAKPIGDPRRPEHRAADHATRRDREGDRRRPLSASPRSCWPPAPSTRYGGVKQHELLPAVLAALARHVGRRGRRRRRSAPACRPDARVVQCPDWERGPGASLRCGLAALGDDVARALIVLADGPELDPRAVDRLPPTRRRFAAASLRRHAQPSGRARAQRVRRRPRRGVARPRSGARRLLRPRVRPATWIRGSRRTSRDRGGVLLSPHADCSRRHSAHPCAGRAGGCRRPVARHRELGHLDRHG